MPLKELDRAMLLASNAVNNAVNAVRDVNPENLSQAEITRWLICSGAIQTAACAFDAAFGITQLDFETGDRLDN